MQFRKKTVVHEKLMVSLNMTPLIDCVLQLLIFFMLSSSFVLQTGIHVDLPKAEAPRVDVEQDIVITITRANELFLNDEKITTDELLNSLLEKVTNTENKTVLIKPDRRVETGKLVEVMGIAKSVGVESLGIITEPK